MPAIDSSNSDSSNTQNDNAASDTILQDIMDENYPKSPNNTVLESFINTILMNQDCDKPPQKERLFDLNCHPVDSLKNMGIHFSLKHLLSENKLYSFLEFLTKNIIANKNTLTDEIKKKLIFLGNHYTILEEDKLKDKKRIFTENDVITTSSFTNFLSSLFNIPDITKIETPGLISRKGKERDSLLNITSGITQGVDMLVGHFIKLIPDLIVKPDYSKHLYKKENLLAFCGNLGDLGFQVKLKEEFGYQAEQIKGIVQIILSSPSSENFRETLKKSAAWTFLNRYHDKNFNDIESDCIHLFGFENCLPPDNESTQLIYESIFKDTIKPNDLNKTNFQLIIDKFSQGTHENIANQLNSLSSTNKLTNFINFFKDYLKQNNNTLDEIYLKKTLKLCNAINEIATANKTSLRNTANKLDIKYFKMIQAQLALMLNLVKSNAEEKLLFDQTHSLSQLENLVIDVIENYHDHKYSNRTDANVENIPKSYLDIINYSKDSNSSLLIGSILFAKSIIKVTKTCLNSKACNNTQIKKQCFEMLGGIVRKLEQANKIHLANEVINLAKELKDIIKNNSNSSDAELGSYVANFLRIRHARDQILMDKDCMDIFGLNPEDCRPFIASNATTIATRIIPETIINSTTISAPQIIANATIASAINQTDNFEPISTIYSDSISEVPTTTEIITDIVQNLGSQFPTITEVGTTSAHSLGSSLINLMTQGTSIWLRSKGYGESIISALSLSLAGGILQASYMATFPLMLYKLNELIASGNEQEAQEAWEMMTQEMLPTFFTSLSLSTGLQLLNYLSENYLSKQSMLKGLVQSIPTLSSLWSFSRNPILSGIHAATAYGVSAAGLFGFNRYWGARNHRNTDVETNAHELQQLNQVHDVKQTNNDATLESKFPEKTYQYITEDKFNQVKQQSESLLEQLETLKSSLLEGIQNNRNEITPKTLPRIAGEYGEIIEDKEHVLKIIQGQTSIMFTHVESLKDKIHGDADKYLEKNRYHAAMEKLGNVFKLMVFVLNTMKTELNGAKGFIEGKNQSFDEISDLLNTLKDIMNFIEFPLSTASFYLNKYNQSGPIEAAEKNGAKKALANQRIFENTTRNTVNPLRIKKTRTCYENRPQSMASDRTLSSHSGDSAISTGSSKDEENAQILRPLLQV